MGKVSVSQVPKLTSLKTGFQSNCDSSTYEHIYIISVLLSSEIHMKKGLSVEKKTY